MLRSASLMVANHALDETEEVGLRTILKRNVVLERQIRAVELEQEALGDDGFVFDLQGAADGCEVGLLGVVVLVADRGDDDAGRGCGEKRLDKSALAGRRARSRTLRKSVHSRSASAAPV